MYGNFSFEVRNSCMEPRCMDTCLGLCIDLLIRKPS